MFGRFCWLRRALGAAMTATTLAGAAMAQSGPQTVPTYHATADRAGLYVVPSLTWANAGGLQMDSGFDGTISGQVFAQPLYWRAATATTGLVIVATTADIVYALDSTTGKIVWQHTLGTAVPRSALPCGNIDPVGVIGTPVIDPATSTVYVAALVTTPAGPRHKVYALAVDTGRLKVGWPVAVQAGLAERGMAFDSSAQGQRSALTFFDGKLYVTYAGNWGDCSTYHGTVIEIGTASRRIIGAWATRANGGGIWGKSGIASDGVSLFVATGNTMGANTWGDGEAVVRLAPGLAHSASTEDFFTPSNWLNLDQSDTDLGGTGPIPVDIPVTRAPALPRVLALGKDGKAYLMDRSNLGGIGGQKAVAQVANSEIISAAARFPMTGAAMVAFVTGSIICPNGQSGGLGVLQLTASPSKPITTAWCAGLNGNGAPIVTTTDGSANPIVWVVGSQGDNQLHGFRGTDGTALFSGGTMANLQRNTTPLVAEGRFYVAGTGKVYAFVQ